MLSSEHSCYVWNNSADDKGASAMNIYRQQNCNMLFFSMWKSSLQFVYTWTITLWHMLELNLSSSLFQQRLVVNDEMSNSLLTTINSEQACFLFYRPCSSRRQWTLFQLKTKVRGARNVLTLTILKASLYLFLRHYTIIFSFCITQVWSF